MELVSCRRTCQGGRSGFGKEDRKIAVLPSYSLFSWTIGDRVWDWTNPRLTVCFLLCCSHLCVEWPGALPSLFLQGKMALRSLGCYNRAGVCGYCQTLKGSLTLNGTQADSRSPELLLFSKHALRLQSSMPLCVLLLLPGRSFHICCLTPPSLVNSSLAFNTLAQMLPPKAFPSFSSSRLPLHLLYFYSTHYILILAYRLDSTIKI